jgi:hypothetical protein
MVKITESQLTVMCFQWAWNQYPKTRYCLFHIVNEGKRSARYGATQKAMGLLSGVPDFCFVWNGKTSFCELKTTTGKLSASQQNIIETWKHQGFDVEVIKSFEDFKLWFIVRMSM